MPLNNDENYTWYDEECLLPRKDWMHTALLLLSWFNKCNSFHNISSQFSVTCLKIRYVYMNLYLLFMKKNLDSGKCFEFFCYVAMLSYRRLAGVKLFSFIFSVVYPHWANKCWLLKTSEDVIFDFAFPRLSGSQKFPFALKILAISLFSCLII